MLGRSLLFGEPSRFFDREHRSRGPRNHFDDDDDDDSNFFLKKALKLTKMLKEIL